MNEAVLFTMHARGEVVRKTPRVVTTPPRVTMDGQSTIMKLCKRCNQQMPHLVRYPVCILCAMDDDGKTTTGDQNQRPG